MGGTSARASNHCSLQCGYWKNRLVVFTSFETCKPRSLFVLGTFITLDICISRLEDVGTADIRGTVEKIRAQRAYSIQMPDQYVFCHLALIEYALAHKHLSPDINLEGFDDHDNSDSD